MSRSSKKGPFVDPKLLKKIAKIKPNESYLLYDFKWVPDGAYQPPHIKDSFWKKVGVNKKSELF